MRRVSKNEWMAVTRPSATSSRCNPNGECPPAGSTRYVLAEGCAALAVAERPGYHLRCLAGNPRPLRCRGYPRCSELAGRPSLAGRPAVGLSDVQPLVGIGAGRDEGKIVSVPPPGRQ